MPRRKDALDYSTAVVILLFGMYFIWQAAKWVAR